ncbi:UNVERIFIED_CONTAM: hypothetical protein Sangu_0186200 [Sesamum angustifolium]|uniref:CCHC-type domain-containing protein n=1 Tax=Sesamum angustifolium TaxID=2727405 RepID=A0AAW2RMB9_9LAMI
MLATSIKRVGGVGAKPRMPHCSRGRRHIAKFEVVKFDGTGNIGLWQTRVKDPLAQQGILKVLWLHKPGSMDDEDWEELQQCAAGTICLYLVDEIMYHVMNLKSPGEMLEGSDLAYHVNVLNQIITYLTSGSEIEYMESSHGDSLYVKGNQDCGLKLEKECSRKRNSKSKSKGKETIHCYKCNEPGHMKRDYPKLKRQADEKRDNSS